ncbi:hypothetical protein ACP4OV_019055 [Aristida adscensionis]
MSVMKIAALVLLALLVVVEADDSNLTEWKPKSKVLQLALDVTAPVNRYNASMKEFYGFKAGGGSWYSFPKWENVIDGSTALKFDEDYSSLTDRRRKDLEKIVVGSRSAQEAVAILANYRQDNTPEKAIKKALIQLIFMFCEAQRFAPFRDAVLRAWPQEQGGTVGRAALELLDNGSWTTISCALLVWDKNKNKKWDTIPEAKRIANIGDPKIRSKETAVKNLFLILRPNNQCSDNKPPRT